jgi:HEAT repeat protein
VRAAAVPALAKVESDDAKLIEVLVKAVSDETGRVRRPAAQAIGKFGDRARAAVPGLVAMLERDKIAARHSRR